MNNRLGYLAQIFQKSTWLQRCSGMGLLVIVVILLLQLNSPTALADVGQPKGCPVNISTTRRLSVAHSAMQQVIRVIGPNCEMSVEESEITVAQAAAEPILTSGIRTGSVRKDLTLNGDNLATATATHIVHSKQLQKDIDGLILTGVEHITSFDYDGIYVTSLNWIQTLWWYKWSTGWIFLGADQSVIAWPPATYASTQGNAGFQWTNGGYYWHNPQNVNRVYTDGGFSPLFYLTGTICSNVGCYLVRIWWIE